MNERQKKTCLLTAVVVAVILPVALGIAQVAQRVSSGTLELTIAPTGAQVSIDDHRASGGSIVLTAGKHTVKVEKKGFTAKSRDLVIKSGQSYDLTIALLSNSAETHDWYLKHPDDQTTLEGESSDQFDKQQANNLARYPVLNYVPHTSYTNGMAAKWTIDPQWASDGNISSLNITAVSCVDSITKSYLAEAKQYLVNSNVDLAKYKIIYMVNCGQITKYQGEV